LRDQFVVDVYQAGAGTSHHMNVNEVLSNRALEIMGDEKGNYKRVSPNDHVNYGQSTNDVIPTAIRIGGLLALEKTLFPALSDAVVALENKAEEFKDIVKSGRTHYARCCAGSTRRYLRRLGANSQRTYLEN
jgi:aspartate ammonia-lyase